jgi:hypothetical protein
MKRILAALVFLSFAGNGTQAGTMQNQSPWSEGRDQLEVVIHA